MTITQLSATIVRCVLLIGFTARVASGNIWRRASSASIYQRNPWQIYGTTRLFDLQSRSDIAVMQQRQYILSIRGGSSAAGKSFYYANFSVAL